MLEVPRGQRIYLAGDPADQIFLLKVGVVKISAGGVNGQDTILAFLYPGDIFGETDSVLDAAISRLTKAAE